jgi:hypothetical protein
MTAHQFAVGAVGAVVLSIRIDRDRTNAADRIALDQKVAAGDLSIDFGHDVEDPLLSDHHGDEAGSRGWARDVGREIVLYGDRLERPIADVAGRHGVFRGASAHA